MIDHIENGMYATGPEYDAWGEPEEVMPRRCDHTGCFRDAHPDSQSNHCVLHELMGWKDELSRDQYNMEIQAEYSSWYARAQKELGPGWMEGL